MAALFAAALAASLALVAHLHGNGDHWPALGGWARPLELLSIASCVMMALAAYRRWRRAEHAARPLRWTCTPFEKDVPRWLALLAVALDRVEPVRSRWRRAIRGPFADPGKTSCGEVRSRRRTGGGPLRGGDVGAWVAAGHSPRRRDAKRRR